MKKRTMGNRLLAILLCLILSFTLSPLPTFADWEDGVDCEYCGSYRYDDWLCEGGDHCGEGSDSESYMYHHCRECGDCADTDFCENHLLCSSCYEGDEDHCEECHECGMDKDFCEEHGICVDCEELLGHRCPKCSEHVERFSGESCNMCDECFDCSGQCADSCTDYCLLCHLAYELACPSCEACFMGSNSDLRCENCYECMDCGSGACEDCQMCKTMRRV